MDSALLLFSLALLPATWVQSHYVAPAFILMFALAVGGLRRISTWPFGRALTTVIALALLVTTSFQAYAILTKSLSPGHYSNQRQDVIDRLLSSDRKHLVFVRYALDHNVHEEWVYNFADIDAAPVIFAREISPDAGWNLMEYYKDRHVHWLDVSGAGATLTAIRPPLAP